MFTENHAIPSIDFAVIHTWSDNWQVGGDRGFQRRWLDSHIQAVASSPGLKDKPLLLEASPFADPFVHDARGLLFAFAAFAFAASDSASWPAF